MSAPSVAVSVGVFDVMGGERETQVLVRISPDLRAAYYMPAAWADRVQLMPWPTLVREAHAHWARNVWIDTSRAQKTAVADWLAVEENEAALHAAWRADQIRRHPIAAELAAEVEQLQAALAEAQAAPLVVWRAYYRDAPSDGFTVGLFRTEEPARAACEDLVRCEQGLREAVITWQDDPEEPDDPRELAVTLPGSTAAAGTGYFVMPVQVQNEYDPEADR